MRWRAIAAAFLAVTAAKAEPPKRIASINLCTDQLLLDLAPSSVILGLSPYAHDPARAWAVDKARAHPALSGRAEEILVLKPDLVLAGRFTRRETRQFLRSQGIRLEEFDVVRSIAEVREQILHAGRLLGQEVRAEARVAAIDAALERLKATAAATRLRVLPVSRRGWVSGADSLTSDLLRAAGLINPARELGLARGGFASLEAIVALKPEAILVSSHDIKAEDQGAAILLHPVLERLYPPARRLTMPENLTICGGPMLAEAIDHLAREITRLELKR